VKNLKSDEKLNIFKKKCSTESVMSSVRLSVGQSPISQSLQYLDSLMFDQKSVNILWTIVRSGIRGP
jgi:hypothetical protein